MTKKLVASPEALRETDNPQSVIFPSFGRFFFIEDGGSKPHPQLADKFHLEAVLILCFFPVFANLQL